MRVCVIGSNGNMGRRYLAILKRLGIKEVSGVDVGDDIQKGFTHYIIATPTNTHAHILEQIYFSGAHPVEVLCEKPIIKVSSGEDIRALERLIDKFHERGSNVYMVNNYNYFYKGINRVGDTVYDFYNSGGDGIWWDCIQLIHLAERSIKLSNESPLWSASINGYPLDRNHVDRSYILMIDDFIRGETKKLWGKKDILEAHLKAYYFEQAH